MFWNFLNGSSLEGQVRLRCSTIQVHTINLTKPYKNNCDKHKVSQEFYVPLKCRRILKNVCYIVLLKLLCVLVNVIRSYTQRRKNDLLKNIIINIKAA